MNIDHLRALLSGERQEPVVVGHIYDPALVRVIRAARTHAVVLSRDNVVKQANKHPDIGFEQYRLLPYVLRYGMVAQEWAEQLIFCWHDHDGRSYRLMVKGTIRGGLGDSSGNDAVHFAISNGLRLRGGCRRRDVAHEP